MTDNPLLTPARHPEDPDAALRPKTLAEFVGQEAARDNLRVFIEAAKSRTRRSSRPATRGVPRARRAISRAPSASIPCPSSAAARVTTRSSSGMSKN